MSNLNLDKLIEFVNNYSVNEAELPISFSVDNYTRTPIYRDNDIEIVVICFASGQTSSVHHHKGSNCVVKVVQGKILELLFNSNRDDLHLESFHYLNQGQISGLDGQQVHQLANMYNNGSVLLNFYSPPFKI